MNANGPDQPGLVYRLTGTVVKHNGNVEMSWMTRLLGEFTMLLLISIDDSKAIKLIKELQNDHGESLNVTVRFPVEKPGLDTEGYIPCDLDVTGPDTPGIMLKVAKTLYDQGVNIISQSSQINEGVVTGRQSFSMKTRLLLPPKLSIEKLRDDMGRIQSETGVEIRLELAPF